MVFNLSNISGSQRDETEGQKVAVEKLNSGMKNNAKFAITPRRDSNGRPYFWVEIILPHKSEGIKLYINVAIVNVLYQYMATGASSTIELNMEQCEELKNEYSEKDFPFELFQMEVNQGKRVNKTSSFHSTRYKCYTTYGNGRGIVNHSLEMTEEVIKFLKEKDLL